MSQMGSLAVRAPGDFFSHIRDCIPLRPSHSLPVSPRATRPGGADVKDAQPSASSLILVCSKHIQLLPWECMVGDTVCVVRVLCVLSLMASWPLNSEQRQAAAGRDGNASVRSEIPVPQLLVCGRIGGGRAVRSNELRRKHAVVKLSFGRLHLHSVNSGLRYLTGVEAAQSSERRREGRTRRSLAKLWSSDKPHRARASTQPPSVNASDIVWPFHSSLLPNGTRSSAIEHSVRYSKLRRQIAILDMARQDANPFTIITWLENNSTSSRQAFRASSMNSRPFPVFVFCLADLYQLCDAILCLLACRPDCALMFVPTAFSVAIIHELLSQRDALLRSTAQPNASLPTRSSSLLAFSREMRMKHGVPLVLFNACS